MKFSILVGGSHRATVTTDLDGKGAFTGAIESAEFGVGVITDGVQEGDHLKGKVFLSGHQAIFTAVLDGGLIRGSMRVGWFFRMDFNGTRVVETGPASPGT